MTVDSIAKPTSVTAFPSAAAESQLRAALLESVKSNAALHGISLPTDAPALSTLSIHLDSLEVFDLLCGVDPIVGFELDASIVKTGGYHSLNEAVEHIMPRIEAAWRQKHKSKGAKK